MRKIAMFLVAFVAAATVGMAQGLPNKAITLSGGGALHLKEGGNNSFNVSVGTINQLTGAVYVQPRLSWSAASSSSLTLAAVPTLQLKKWGNATVYGGAEVSAAFSSAKTYVQYSPELGVVCALGKNAFALTRLNYNLKDNEANRLDLRFGFGVKL